MFDARWRPRFERAVGPLASTLRRTGVTADQLTAFGLLVAVGAAVAIGKGWLGLGLVLLVISGIPDLLDGAVAKASGTVSARGAFFDSVADRVSDSLLLGGFAWYLTRTGHGEVALVPFLLLGLCFLISYERAKAESLGYSARGGFMERGERLVGLGAALVLPSLMVPLLWAMVVLSALTVVQRFAMVWRQASSDLAHRPARVPAKRPFRAARVESRWRAWREAAVQRAERPRAGRVTRRWRDRRAGEPIGRWRAQRERAGSPASFRRRRWSSGGSVLSGWRDGTGTSA